MSKLEFKPDDFQKYTGSTRDTSGIYLTTQGAANAANARLAEMLKDAKVVYANLNFPPDMNPVWGVSQEADTHRALLVNIEELPKEPCKHELPEFPKTIDFSGHPLDDWGMAVDEWFGSFISGGMKCKHCGVKIIARWEPDDE